MTNSSVYVFKLGEKKKKEDRDKDKDLVGARARVTIRHASLFNLAVAR